MKTTKPKRNTRTVTPAWLQHEQPKPSPLPTPPSRPEAKSKKVEMEMEVAKNFSLIRGRIRELSSRVDDLQKAMAMFAELRDRVEKLEWLMVDYGRGTERIPPHGVN